MPSARPRLLPFLGFALFLSATTAALAQNPPGAEPTWKRLADLPTPQAFPAQTPQRIGDRLFLLAGADYRVTALLVYDPAADAWTSKPTELLTNRHHYATAALGGKLYVAGGCLGESDAVPHRRTNAFESYDPETGLWTPLPPMPTARQAFQLVPFGDELYAIGGVDRPEEPITTIEIFNPAAGTWRSVPAPWGQSLGWVAAAVHGDRILALGRMMERSAFIEYHPRANTFVEKPVGPAGDKRNYGVALVRDALLLVGAGGEQPGAAVIGFDLVANTWREFPALPQARGHAGVTAIGNRVLCLGGWGPTWDWAHPNTSAFELNLDGSPLDRAEPAPPVARPFAPGVISTAAHGALTFTPDGKTVYFCRHTPLPCRILVSQQDPTSGLWSEPRPASFSTETSDDGDPFITPDGSRLYFWSCRRQNQKDKRIASLYVVNRTENGWSEPIKLGSTINTADASTGFPTLSKDQTLYFFTRRKDSLGQTDIYSARRIGDEYDEAENLGPTINSPASELDALIAPDGAFLVFCSDRPGGYGGFDLYVSQFEKGQWTPARNAGSVVNSAGDEFCPALSVDGEKFYFSRTTKDNADLISGIYEADFAALGILASQE